MKGPPEGEADENDVLGRRVSERAERRKTKHRGSRIRKHCDPRTPKSPDVEAQWDPERWDGTISLGKLEDGGIQIGIPEAVSLG